MINFNSKYLTYAALVLLAYLMYSRNTFHALFGGSKMVDSTSAKYTLTIDPTKKPEDRTFVESVIMKIYGKELKPYMKERKAPLVVSKGLYVTLKVSDKGEIGSDDYQPKIISGLVGRLDLDPLMQDSIIGMKEKEMKEVESNDNKTYLIEVMRISEINVPKAQFK